MRPLADFVNTTFQGIIHECPYFGNIKIENATYDRNGKAMEDLAKVQIFPNGQYKTWVMIFSDKDSNIANVTVFFDVVDRMSVLNNDENF